MVLFFPTGSESVLARCVTYEVRAQLGKDRMNQREFATRLGFSSHNYISVRLRDEKPFTLDDVDKMCRLWDIDPEEFIQQAVASNLDRVMADLHQATDSSRVTVTTQPLQVDYVFMQDGEVEIVEAKREPTAARKAFVRIYTYDDGVQVANSKGEAISHHDTREDAVRAARELVETSAGAVSDLPSLADRRKTQRTYAQPVKRAARKGAGKKKLADE